MRIITSRVAFLHSCSWVSLVKQFVRAVCVYVYLCVSVLQCSVALTVLSTFCFQCLQVSSHLLHSCLCKHTHTIWYVFMTYNVCVHHMTIQASLYVTLCKMRAINPYTYKMCVSVWNRPATCPSRRPVCSFCLSSPRASVLPDDELPERERETYKCTFLWRASDSVIFWSQTCWCSKAARLSISSLFSSFCFCSAEFTMVNSTCQSQGWRGCW